MTVTLTDMRTTIETIVTAYPDDKGNDEASNYNDDGTPCCIAGHVYDALNALPECMEGSVDALAEETPFLTDDAGWSDEAIEFLSQLQAYADAGLTWRTALRETIRVAGG